MIIEFAHFALILAWIVSFIQAVIVLLEKYYKKNQPFVSTVRSASAIQLVLVIIAFLGLEYAYITSDFSVLNVAENSHSAKPLFYKISGVWGNHEGSMLLWILILTGLGATFAIFTKSIPSSFKIKVLSIQGFLSFLFITFVLFLSNPFLRLDPAPLNGQDLNPLLQDPGLAFHPPLLYLGYVGFSLPFSFAIAALLETNIDSQWAKYIRPWTILAWIGLTLGILLGSWWAYYELGWGGWWFWDPVENASLMPWLSGTALIHTIRVVEKRDALKSWAVLLTILTFSLSLIGTFLVRSGILTSVHAFALDPSRGIAILVILFMVIGIALGLYGWRALHLKPSGFFHPISREGVIVLNNLFLSTAIATVLIGTLYPLFVSALDAGSISVGPPYFNLTVIPLLLPMLIAMALGPLMPWKKADLWVILKKLKIVALFILAVMGMTFYIYGLKSIIGFIAVSAAIWCICVTLFDLMERLHIGRESWSHIKARIKGLSKSIWGTALAHIGVGIAVLGMTGSLWTAEVIARVKTGENLDISGYTLTFKKTETVLGQNYSAERSLFHVYRGKDYITSLMPEKRYYPVAQTATTEAAIYTNGWSNLYMALGDRNENGQIVRIWHHPLTPLIWIGGLIIALGGLFSLFDQKSSLKREREI